MIYKKKSEAVKFILYRHLSRIHVVFGSKSCLSGSFSEGSHFLTFYMCIEIVPAGYINILVSFCIGEEEANPRCGLSRVASFDCHHNV